MKKPSGFVVCISNKGYPASLEQRKLYPFIRDAEAERHKMIRVIDESGEDYLFPAKYFVLVELPATTRRKLQLTK
jgi:hypothetical protein